MVDTPEPSQPEPSRETRISARPPAPAAATQAGGLPGWFWMVTGLVESAVIITALVLLVYYAVR